MEVVDTNVRESDPGNHPEGRALNIVLRQFAIVSTIGFGRIVDGLPANPQSFVLLKLKTATSNLFVGGTMNSTSWNIAAVFVLGILTVFGCQKSSLVSDVSEDSVVLDDGRNWGDDPYSVNSVNISGNRLTLSVSYSGGCKNHVFTLVIAKSFLESDPVQLPAVLSHNANGDRCEAYPTESLDFDLSLVKTRYQQFYGSGPGKVVLRIKGVSEKALVFEFDG